MFINMKQVFQLLLALFLLNACTGVPQNIQPVNDFELEPYLGRWYEVARLPHSFEEGMNQVTAEYSLNPDGSVKVINQGFDLCEQTWDNAIGKAKFVEAKNTGHLKVSFFGPFYGSYIVFKLGPIENNQYQYAFVSGPDTDYLWLLARKPQVSESVKQNFIEQANNAGFNTHKLVWVNALKTCLE